jgi:crotonobetainyl-CoA:carnitine CoA-transferase CaiB-like acyl-CoA transferase
MFPVATYLKTHTSCRVGKWVVRVETGVGVNVVRVRVMRNSVTTRSFQCHKHNKSVIVMDTRGELSRAIFNY